MTEHRRYLTLLSLWIFSLVFVHCQDSTTFSPVRAPCVGDTIEMVCSIQPPPSETFGGSVALVSINGSNPFTQVQLNSNSMLDGIDLSRYSANVDGLNPSTAMPVIRLIINSYLPLDSDTTFLCSTTFVNGSQYDSTMPDSPMPQAAPPSPPVSLTADFNSPTCSGAVQLAWTPGASDRDIKMYFLSLNGVLIASLGSVTSYNHSTTLQRDTEYAYSVVAMSCAGNSTQIAATSISVGNPPSSPLVTLSQTDISCSNTLISWSTPSSDRPIFTYSVYRNGTFLSNTTTNQYTDNTQLNVSTVYEYSVVAASCAGISTAGVKSVSLGYTLCSIDVDYTEANDLVSLSWVLNPDPETQVTLLLNFAFQLSYNYTQNNIVHYYPPENRTFTEYSNTTDYNLTDLITPHNFTGDEVVDMKIEVCLRILNQNGLTFYDAIECDIFNSVEHGLPEDGLSTGEYIAIGVAVFCLCCGCVLIVTGVSILIIVCVSKKKGKEYSMFNSKKKSDSHELDEQTYSQINKENKKSKKQTPVEEKKMKCLCCLGSKNSKSGSVELEEQMYSQVNKETKKSKKQPPVEKKKMKGLYADIDHVLQKPDTLKKPEPIEETMYSQVHSLH